MANTLGELRTLVLYWVKVSGQPYITDDQAVNALITRRLRAFTKESLCLHDVAQNFAVQANVAEYKLEGTTNPVTSSSIEWAWINHVVVNDKALRDFDGEVGPVLFSQLQRAYPTYSTSTTGEPTLWSRSSPSSIYLWRKPDSAYSNCSVSGYRVHTTLTSDNDTLLTPLDWFDTLAVYIAIDLIGPYAAGSSLEKMAAISQVAAQRFQEIREQALDRQVGSTSRGDWLGQQVVWS